MDFNYENVWAPPKYDISAPPTLKHSTIPSSSSKHDFSRSAKWSPDGSSFITHMEDGSLHVTKVPNELLGPITGPSFSQKSTTTPIPAKNVDTKIFRQASPVIDYAWYPTASAHEPSTYCFVASVREAPVKLLDANDGRLRASYSIVDHRERQIAPHCLAFNLTAQRLYCTFEDAIEVFDVSRPGKGLRLHTVPSKKSKDGLKGLLSSIAFTPSYESPSSDLFAVGSLSPVQGGNIAIFNNDHESISPGQDGKTLNGTDVVNINPMMFVGGGPRAGVSQLQFNPMRPHILYASFRRHLDIYAWDLRSNVDHPIEILTRPNSSDTSMGTSISERIWTNQRMRFDIELSGRLLGVGDQLGIVSIFDLGDPIQDTNATTVVVSDHAMNPDTPGGHNGPTSQAPMPGRVVPRLEFSGHEDAVGSVSFHPLTATLLSVSGSRHFDLDDDDSDSDSNPDTESDPEDLECISRNHRGRDDGSDKVEEIKQAKVVHSIEKGLRPTAIDSSIKLWDFS
ncbi:hypothetical protein AX16_002994 [Volvariella volvacea WC 439]|nr:hypothetical protein AX16_002994 [Volvariella volvacea WC 439]